MRARSVSSRIIGEELGARSASSRIIGEWSWEQGGRNLKSAELKEMEEREDRTVLTG